MRRRALAAAALVAALALAGCSALHPFGLAGGPGSLGASPDGTVDTTHGAKGSQTTPH
jgi:ABC-type glycerol-3-phosphate transport system substrate-binding protein